MAKRELTASYIKALKPPEKGRLDITDARERGLVLRVTPNGVLTWVLRYRDRITGKTHRYKLGHYPDLSLSMARERATEERAKVTNGINPQVALQQARKAHRDGMTFDQLVKLYIKRTAMNKRSWKYEQSTLERDAVTAWGRRKADSINRKDVLNLIDAITDRGAPILANRVHSLVSRVFSWAVENEHLSVNPAASIKRRNKETTKTRVLSDAELVQLLRGLENVPPNVALALRLMIATATRANEVAGVCRSEIDWDNATWILPAERSKNGKEHLIPLSPMALSILRSADALSEGREHLFPARAGAYLARQRLWQAMHDATADDPLPGGRASPHDLRRSAATGIAKLGFSDEVVSRVLNHKPPGLGVTAIYNRHKYSDEKRQALDAWARHIEGLLGDGSAAKVIPMVRS